MVSEEEIMDDIEEKDLSSQPTYELMENDQGHIPRLCLIKDPQACYRALRPE